MTGKNRVVLMHLILALRYFAYMEKQSGKVEGVSAEVLKRIFLIF